MGLLLATPAISASQESAPSLSVDTADPARETIFLAPFVNASFLQAVQEILEEIRLMQELTTGIYLDQKTGLLWAARDNGRDIDWRRAFEYCEQLALAGFEDWRMPSLAELENLMEPMSNSMYSVPLEISLSACCIWSSTSKDEVAAWNLNYRYSKKFTGSKTHTFDLRALCVRQWLEEDGLLLEPMVPTEIE